MKFKFVLRSSNKKMNLQHLAGHGGDFAPSESWSGPDPDPDPNQNHNRKQHADSDSVQKKKLRETLFSGKAEKTKGSLHSHVFSTFFFSL